MLAAQPVTLNAVELAALLQLSPATVKSEYYRAPHRFPPALELGFGRLVWLYEGVISWLESKRKTPVLPRRRRGRPTKLAQMRRAAA